jgi:hypothetical protein
MRHSRNQQGVSYADLQSPSVPGPGYRQRSRAPPQPGWDLAEVETCLLWKTAAGSLDAQQVLNACSPPGSCAPAGATAWGELRRQGSLRRASRSFSWREKSLNVLRPPARPGCVSAADLYSVGCLTLVDEIEAQLCQPQSVVVTARRNLSVRRRKGERSRRRQAGRWVGEAAGQGRKLLRHVGKRLLSGVPVEALSVFSSRPWSGTVSKAQVVIRPSPAGRRAPPNLIGG